MKPVFSIATLCAVVLSTSGCALQPSATESAATGRVTGLYREVRPSVLVAADIHPGDLSHPLWVQVDFAEPLADGTVSTTARAEPGQHLEVGDRVALDMARRGPAAGLLPRPTMVAAVLDRNDHFAQDNGRPLAQRPARNSRVSVLQELDPYTAKP